MFSKEAVDALISEEGDVEDIVLASGLLPQVNLSAAIDLMKFGESTSNNKRKATTGDIDDSKNDDTSNDYDGTEPVKPKKKLGFKPRERTQRVPKEESHHIGTGDTYIQRRVAIN